MPAETHVEKGPLDRQQILELVRELLADILEIEPSTISESSSFAEDLDADSLALIELVEGLEEELGDLLLQPVFFAEMATQEGRFSIADSLDRINQKLVRRHPHIFGDAQADSPEEVKQRWDEIKKQEKSERGDVPAQSVLGGVPRALPALVECEKIGQKAAGEGFDWPDVSGALEKLQEEAQELAEAREHHHVEHELGGLVLGVAEVRLEDIRHVAHEVDRVVVDDRDPGDVGLGYGEDLLRRLGAFDL